MLRRLRVAVVAILLGCSAAVAAASGAGMTLDVVTIAGGRLVIAGNTSAPHTIVRIPGTSFQATSGADRAFSFNVIYRTPNCRVILATKVGTLTALVSNCGPQGVQGKVRLATQGNAGRLDQREKTAPEVSKVWPVPLGRRGRKECEVQQDRGANLSSSA